MLSRVKLICADLERRSLISEGVSEYVDGFYDTVTNRQVLTGLQSNCTRADFFSIIEALAGGSSEHDADPDAL